MLLSILCIAILLTACEMGEGYIADMGEQIGQTVKDAVSESIDGIIEESAQNIKNGATEKIDETLSGVSDFVAGKMIVSPDEIMWTLGNIQYSAYWEDEEVGEKIDRPFVSVLDTGNTESQASPYLRKVQDYLDTEEPIQIVSDGAVITLTFFEDLPETVVIRRDENIVTIGEDIYIDPYEVETKEMENPLTGKATYSFSNFYNGASTACYIANCTFTDGEEVEIAFLVERE